MFVAQSHMEKLCIYRAGMFRFKIDQLTTVVHVSGSRSPCHRQKDRSMLTMWYRSHLPLTMTGTHSYYFRKKCSVSTMGHRVGIQPCCFRQNNSRSAVMQATFSSVHRKNRSVLIVGHVGYGAGAKPPMCFQRWGEIHSCTSKIGHNEEACQSANKKERREGHEGFSCTVRIQCDTQYYMHAVLHHTAQILHNITTTAF